jgi:hypothetical protein
MAVADELEEDGLASDDSALQRRMKLGAAWCMATLAGVAALAYSSIAELPSSTTMLVLGGLLGAYAAYGYFVKNKNTVQFADSLYYMGFLWSLFALLATFVIWPPAKLTPDAVLSAFGYALVATFCGMLLRFVTLQFHETVSDRVASAQDTIDRRVAALTRQLNDATMEISAFRDRAANDLGATLYDLVQSLAAVRDKIADQHLRMAKATSEGFESSLREILGRLSAIHIPQDMLSEEVGKVVAALGRQGEHFAKAAQRLEITLQQAAETVTDFAESLAGSAAAKEVGAAIHELTTKIKERTNQFADMTAALQQSRTELDGQLGSLQSLRSAVSTVSSQLCVFEAELKDVSAASMSADLKTGLINVQQAIRSSLDASKAIESTMRDVLFFMKERVTEERSGGRN